MAKQQVKSGGVRVGGLMVSVWCKPPIGRIYKSSGLKPSDRNARAIAEEIADMIRSLNRLGDVATLRKIKNGPRKGGVGLIEALHAYRTNTHHLLNAGGSLNLLAELTKYVESGPQAATTRKRFGYTVRALQSHRLLDERQTVAELPEVVERMRRFYEARKNADMFNNTRQFLLAFVTKHLLVKKSDRLYTSIQDVPSLPVPSRKEHHPFLGPQEMLEFINELMLREEIHIERRQLYAEAVVTCCLTGMRPEEYVGQVFRHDSKADFGTGHLLIEGTKTVQSRRVVPKLTFPTLIGIHGLRVATLNKVLSGVGDGKVRMRDFRRTYSIWCEKAGVSASHVARYMGHKQRGTFAQTAHYQRHKPNTAELNADLNLLEDWIRAQLSKVPNKERAAWPASSVNKLSELFTLFDEARAKVPSKRNARLDAKVESEDAEQGEPNPH